jgi:hypothetical protein
MIFKFKQNKIILDCFTKEESILKTAPIDYAIKHIPDWWKQLSSSVISEDGFSPMPTAKKCVGIVDYYKHSIAIPLWSDLAIKIGEQNSYQWHFADNTTHAIVHDLKSQATGFLPNCGHMKIISPWLFQTKEELKWVWSHPNYSFKDNNDITSLPAIIDFKYQNGTNINIMLNLQEQKTILLNHGQVMAHITPMTDKKIEIVRHLVSEQEFNRLSGLNRNVTFLDKYKTIKQKTKKFSKCPFHKS